jgi:hypothetical protein
VNVKNAILLSPFSYYTNYRLTVNRDLNKKRKNVLTVKMGGLSGRDQIRGANTTPTKINPLLGGFAAGPEPL